MATVNEKMTAIADAIRTKTGGTEKLTLDDMATNINTIETVDDLFPVRPFTYTVDAIDGASYGFEINDDGYYESQNKGVNNSYAICRVNLTVEKVCDITFDVINYAEARNDYALFGNIDSALTLLSSADSVGVKRNFQYSNSDSVVNVIYNDVPIGSHFIDIKFIKSSSVNSNNDSVQFKIRCDNYLPQKTIDKIVEADIDLVPENVKSGVDIFGVVGTYKDIRVDRSVEDSIVTRTLTEYTNDRVTYIGSTAFYNCSSLTSISLPAVTSIGSGAFAFCSSLTSVNFPAATYIGSDAFSRCTSLTSVNFPVATSIGGSNAFYGCTRLTSVNFPAATYIGSTAFHNCSSLTSVNFPAATSIGSEAFHNCSSLTSINFPVATSIRSDAFSRCTSLTSVNFPAATSIGSGAFFGCTSLTSVNFPAATYIGSYAFCGCTSLTSIEFPAVLRIDYYAFSYCTSLTNVNFPVAISVPARTFYNCSSLISASFPVLSYVNNDTFYNCSSLTNVNLSAATYIGSTAFYRCSSLTSISLPAVTSIGSYAFRNCATLSTVIIGTSTVCQLLASTAFSSTPYAGYSTYFSGTPYIYVPSSLIASYKTATNWVYFSNYFSAIEDMQTQ